MKNEPTGHRLGSLSTSWTLVQQAHADSGDTAALAQRLLLERYGGAVRRYLRGVVGDVHMADELAQEFGLLLVRQKFRRADPGRGRFRDYVKTVLRHLAQRHLRNASRQPRPLSAETAAQLADSVDAGEFDRTFDESWREQLLARVWEQLRSVRPTFYDVLRLRADHPDLTSAELAERLGSATSADAVRQNLRRARERFGDLLLHEIACSLDVPTREKLQDELDELRLLDYCQEALRRYRT